MKTHKISSLVIILLVAIGINYAFVSHKSGLVEIVTTTDFKQVEHHVNALITKCDISEILIVLDIDNTLLTSTTALGGDIWYQWQRGKLDIKPTADQEVDCLFEDAIGLLYELNPMTLTDTIIPDLISDWQSQGITTFALTSRSPKYRAATERELSRQSIAFSKTGLRPKGEELPVYRYVLERELSYMNGIMMTSGMNKGDMLKHLILKTGTTFKSIVFVDDSEKNVQNLEQAFTSEQTDLTIFYYTKIVEDRKAANGGLELTHEQANQMDADWKTLNKTLQTIFPARKIEGGCLGGN
jgi:hypothetical protein